MTAARDSQSRALSPAWRQLLLTSAALILVNALHGIDHVRQELGRLTAEVIVGGQGLLLLALIPFALALRRHRAAPVVAALVGAWTALAVSASHLAPHRKGFSDPYLDKALDALSWALMLSVIATAAVLAALGLAAARRRGDDRQPSASPQPTGSLMSRGACVPLLGSGSGYRRTKAAWV